jgi:hypothetical protein
MKKHTHKYELTEFGNKGYLVYKCILTDCPHFIPQKLALGRLSLCHGCDNEVMITRNMIWEKRKRPMCERCSVERIKRRKELSQVGRSL